MPAVCAVPAVTEAPHGRTHSHWCKEAPVGGWLHSWAWAAVIQDGVGPAVAAVVPEAVGAADASPSPAQLEVPCAAELLASCWPAVVASPAGGGAPAAAQAGCPQTQVAFLHSAVLLCAVPAVAAGQAWHDLQGCVGAGRDTNVQQAVVVAAAAAVVDVQLPDQPQMEGSAPPVRLP